MMDLNVTFAELTLPPDGEEQTRQVEEPGRASNWGGPETFAKTRSEDGEASLGFKPDYHYMDKGPQAEHPGKHTPNRSSESWQRQEK